MKGINENMQGLNIEKIKKNICIGDIVRVPKEILHVGKDKYGRIVAIYDNFFNVEFNEGYQESILYIDAKLIWNIC